MGLLVEKPVRLGTNAEIGKIIVFLNYTGPLLQFRFLEDTIRVEENVNITPSGLCFCILCVHV